MKQTKKQIAERADAIEQLRGMLKPGDTVATILRHVSRSGMRRCISPVFNGRDMSYLVALAMNDRVSDRHGGIVCDGCGMDMGLHLVYTLGATLWPNGTPAPHGVRNGEPDYSGGYALKHRWL